ncbi:hypothetical protein RB597_006378 [Gaeumannomyces tritici]
MNITAPVLRLVRPARLISGGAVGCPYRQQCRSLGHSTALSAGHNKWSKIRHEKGAADIKKTALRAQMSKALSNACKMFGEGSPQLATAVTAAKKAGVPKAVMDAAIARGLGRSATGAALESMIFEVVVPLPSSVSVAVLVEVETDSKLRSLHDINATIKKNSGTVTPAKFFFSRAGRAVFARHDSLGPDQLMDDAIEAGAEDLESDEEGNIVVWTQPTQVTQLVKDLAPKFGLETLSSEIIWSPVEDTMATVDSSDEAKRLAELLSALREHSEVQSIYSNAARGQSLSDEDWSSVVESLDS